MIAGRWQQTKDLFDAALALPSLQRAQYLADVCADPELRREVESLIAAHADAGSFLSGPASGMELVADDEPVELTGNTRYRVRRPLGAGAFGIVYEVEDRRSGALLALKTLRRPARPDANQLKREFRALADIVHTNLVALHELVLDDEAAFFTMERIEGTTFLQYVRPGGPEGRCDTTRLRHALRQMIDGLMAVHESGRLHRDLKPSNVLVTTEGRVVILDFGLVAELAPTPAGADGSGLAGTPAYMAPEQGLSRARTAAIDWYAVGIMIFEALTGFVPFSGDLFEVLQQKRTAEPPCVRATVPDVPADIEAVCRGFLEPQPERRLSGRAARARLAGDDADEASRLPVVPAAAGLVGRHAERAVLHRALDVVRGGTLQIVLLEGRSGIGKTALMRRFAEEVTSHLDERALILNGRCHERESIPYKALDAWVETLGEFLRHQPRTVRERVVPWNAAELIQLFPALGPCLFGQNPLPTSSIVDFQERRRRAFRSLRDLLLRVGERWTVLVFIDDLQWGDLDSAEALRELLSPPHPPSFLFVGAYRTEDARQSAFLSSFLDSFGASPLTRSVPLSELSWADACALARALAWPGDVRTTPVEAIARESGGSPFFIEILSSHAGSVRALEGEPGAALETVLHARVAELPAAARRLLEAVAVAGQPIEQGVARHAAELAAEEVAPFNVLRMGHYTRSYASKAGHVLEVYHDRIRQAVLTGLGVESLRALHGRLADALDAGGQGDSAAIAGHLVAAGHRSRARSYAVSAADGAAHALAFDRAASLYQLALDLEPTPDERRLLEAKRADALVFAGRRAEAADAYSAAADLAQGTPALQLRRRAAEQYLWSLQVEKGLGVARAILASLGRSLPDASRVELIRGLLTRAWWRIGGARRDAGDARGRSVPEEQLIALDTYWSVVVGLSFADPFHSWVAQGHHLALALEAGDPYRLARALATEAGHVASMGQSRRGRAGALLARAATFAAQSGSAHAAVFVSGMIGFAHQFFGEWREAEPRFASAARRLRETCTDATWELAVTELNRLRSLFYLGEWGRIVVRLPSLLEEARARDDGVLQRGLVEGFTYFEHLAHDDADAARRALRGGLDANELETRRRLSFWQVSAEIDVELYERRAEDAHRLISDLWPALQKSLTRRIQFQRVSALWLRGRCRLGCLESRAALASPDDPLLRGAVSDARQITREGMPWGDILAATIEAGAAASCGRRTEAIELLTRAESACAQQGVGGFQTAMLRRRRGQLVTGDEGRRMVEAADAVMAGQGIDNPARLTSVYAPGHFLDC